MTTKSYLRILRSVLAALLLTAPLTACGGNGGAASGPSTRTETSPQTDPETQPETQPETDAPDESLLVIGEGSSKYTLSADTDKARIAAYSMRDVLADATGVTLPVGNAEKRRRSPGYP